MAIAHTYQDGELLIANTLNSNLTNLDERLTALEASEHPWEKLTTWLGGWNSDDCYIRRLGNIVQVKGYARPQNGTFPMGTYAILTIPNSYTPKEQRQGIIAGTNYDGSQWRQYPVGWSINNVNKQLTISLQQNATLWGVQIDFTYVID